MMPRCACRGLPAHAKVGLADHMGSADGAEHQRLRGLVGRAFSVRRLESFRPVVQRPATELIDRPVPGIRGLRQLPVTFTPTGS
jgi:cytochrome P450